MTPFTEKKYSVKSVTISRKPSEKKDGSWSAFIGLFEKNNPHLTAKIPFEVLEIPQIEKVRLRELRNVSFYLMGNDLIINNLVSVSIKKEDNILTITGKQNLPK